MTPAARIAASIDLLAEIAAAPHRPADAVANAFFRTRRFIGSTDRRAVADRVWGVLRGHRRLTWTLAQAGTDAAPRLLVAASLRTDATKESLENLFSGAPYAAAPLTPAEAAALRRLRPDDPAMPEPVRLEVPDWLFPRLISAFPGTYGAELAALIPEASLDLRVNLLKTTREQAQSALAAEGIVATPTPYSPWGLRVAGRRPVVTGAAFRAGLVEIQDEGSQLVAALVGATAKMRVADYCAGAGGKTLALAMAMQNQGRLVACDIAPARLDGAIRRLRRAGVHNAERRLLDGTSSWARRNAEKFDRVLVDAPCSGTGTWRRRPEARHRLTEPELLAYLPRQSAILDQAARLVRKGGRLVYATCSLLPEENEAQVSAFLDRHGDYALLPPARAGTDRMPVAAAMPWLRLTPATHGTDGFFAAILERTR